MQKRGVYTLIEVSHLTKRYGAHLAVDDISFTVEDGCIYGLLGPNGAGKTTLIRIINRITAPDSGEITFDGHAFGPDDVRSIGYLPEERGLYKKMKVGEQAIYLAQLKGLSYAEAKSRLKVWFETFGIMPWWNKKLEELSKGMQQKVQFVITVLHRPPLLIFDEPFSGFDPVNAELLKKEILKLRDEGHTVIFSTHNMSSVEEVCDDIALINNSKVVLSGTVADVKEQFRTGVFELITRSGDLAADPSLFEIADHSQAGGFHRYLLRKSTAAATGSDIIRAVADRAEVRSFCEQMPSMQEIFLRVVGH